jgi:hypothetical protein
MEAATETAAMEAATEAAAMETATAAMAKGRGGLARYQRRAQHGRSH